VVNDERSVREMEKIREASGHTSFYPVLDADMRQVSSSPCGAPQPTPTELGDAGVMWPSPRFVSWLVRQGS
jgi:hypothetical protein